MSPQQEQPPPSNPQKQQQPSPDPKMFEQDFVPQLTTYTDPVTGKTMPQVAVHPNEAKI